jgi:PadR family transcriptional regulator, regulatory protein PadR
MGVRFRKTPALLAVLRVLLHVDRPYGLEIIERTGLPSGTVYPLLARLERDGWVTSFWETEDQDARGPRRRFYEISVDGAERARAALAGKQPSAGGVIVAGRSARRGFAAREAP